MSKRKNSFCKDFEKAFKNIKRSLKGAHFVHCNMCNCKISLEAIEKTVVSAHNASQKHKKCAGMIDTNQSIKNFLQGNLSQRPQIIRQLLLRVPGHTTLSDTNNHSIPMTARPNYSKQFSLIQTLLRNLLLPEQR